MEIVLSLAEMYTLPAIALGAARHVARRVRRCLVWAPGTKRRGLHCRLRFAVVRLVGAAGAAAAVPYAAASGQDTRSAAAPRPEDVRTLDGILRAFYETVSGPAGQPRQWRRDSALYLPTHRFVATGGRATGAGGALHVMDHQTFAAITDSLLTPAGFYEREIKRVTARFGSVAHVLSTYETRRTPDGPVVDRGVNSLQLVWDGARWWIASTAWDTERPDNPIPAALRP